MQSKIFLTTKYTSDLVDKLGRADMTLYKNKIGIGILFSKFLIKNKYHNKDEKWNYRLSLNANSFLKLIFRGSVYTHILKSLEQNGVIKIHDSYQVGSFSKEYEIVDKKFFEGKVEWKAIRNKTMIKNIEKINIYRKKNLSPLHLKLEDDLKYISLDIEKATKDIEELYTKDTYFQKKADSYNADLKRKQNMKRVSDRILAQKNKTAEDYYLSYLNCLEIYKNYEYVTVDAYGRMHSKLTNFPSKLRDSIYIDDTNKTATIDIKCSQPMFFYCYLASLPKLTTLERRELKEFYNQIYNSPNGKDIYSCWDCTKNLPRKQQKGKFFGEILYPHYAYATDFELNMEFENRFPRIHKRIKELSLSGENLATQMQKMESEFMYDYLLPEIYRRFPTIKLGTMHDSIFCYQGYAPIIKKIFFHQFMEKFDKEIEIDITKYN